MFKNKLSGYKIDHRFYLLLCSRMQQQEKMRDFIKFANVAKTALTEDDKVKLRIAIVKMTFEIIAQYYSTLTDEQKLLFNDLWSQCEKDEEKSFSLLFEGILKQYPEFSAAKEFTASVFDWSAILRLVRWNLIQIGGESAGMVFAPFIKLE